MKINKSVFTMSGLVSTLLAGMGFNVQAIQQAAESELNNRTQVGDSEEHGLRNKAKDMRAESAVTLAFSQNISDVTAFIQWGQADCGTVDKLAAKVAKAGGEMKLTSIPATLSKRDVAGWLKSKPGFIGKPVKAGKPVKSKAPAVPAVKVPAIVPAIANPVLA